MTRHKQRIRNACIEAMARAYYGDDDQWARIPEHWQEKELAKAGRVFDALHDLATVHPVEATEEIIAAGNDEGGSDYGMSEEDLRLLWRAMSAAGDLTNPQEKKP